MTKSSSANAAIGADGQRSIPGIALMKEREFRGVFYQPKSPVKLDFLKVPKIFFSAF